MINSLIDTLYSGSISTLGTSITGTIIDASDPDVGGWWWHNGDFIEPASFCTEVSGTTVFVSIPISSLNEIMNLERNGYNTAQAINYVESCSNEEVNDMLNQIDDLLDDNTNTHEDVKTLSRSI